MSTLITAHFSLEEMTKTSHAEIDNTMPDDLKDNMAETCLLMEKVRSLLKLPIHVNSGFRCAALNEAIGGSKTSAHMQALACDFTSPDYGTPIDICETIANSNLLFDQLIYEHTWVHISMPPKDKTYRREILTLIGPNAYARGIVKS